MTKSIQGFTSHLPSLPSAKKTLAISLAILTITSLGAYLYFCGPHLPVSSMAWKFAACGIALAGGITVMAFIIIRRSSTEKATTKRPEKVKSTVTLGDGSGPSKPEAKKISEKTLKVLDDVTALRILYSLSHAEDQSPEYYQQIVAYFTKSPEKAEEVFRKTVQSSDRKKIHWVSDQLALKLVKEFADNKKWLASMINGTLSRKKYLGLMHTAILRKIYKDPELKIALSNICEILLNDQQILLRILKVDSWKYDSDLFRILLSNFDFNDAELIDSLLSTRFNLNADCSWKKFLLKQLASIGNEEDMFAVILRLEKQSKLVVLSLIKKKSLPLFFPLTPFLPKINLNSFRKDLSPENKDAFDKYCLEFLKADSRISHVELPDFDINRPLKEEELSRLEMATFNYDSSYFGDYESSKHAIVNFTPFHVLQNYFESMTEDQLSKSLKILVEEKGNPFHPNGRILPWMQARLIALLVIKSPNPEKWLNFLGKDINDAERIVHIFTRAPHKHPKLKELIPAVFDRLDEDMKASVFLEYSKQASNPSFKILFSSFYDWVSVNSKWDILEDSLGKMGIGSLRKTLSLLLKKDVEVFKKVILKLTDHQLIRLLSGFEDFENPLNSHLLPLCIHISPKTFVNEIEGFGVYAFTTFFTMVFEGNHYEDPAIKNMITKLIQELEKNEIIISIKNKSLKEAFDID